MSALAWAAVGFGVWLAVAVPVAVVIGRVARNRDRQIPSDR